VVQKEMGKSTHVLILINLLGSKAFPSTFQWI